MIATPLVQHAQDLQILNVQPVTALLGFYNQMDLVLRVVKLTHFTPHLSPTANAVRYVVTGNFWAGLLSHVTTEVLTKPMVALATALLKMGGNA